MSNKILLSVLITVIFLSSVIAIPVGAQGITEPIEKCTLRDTIQINIRVDGTPGNDIAAILANYIVSSISADMVGVTNVSDQDPAAPAQEMASQAQADAIAKRWAIICLVNTINTVVDWVFYILISIVLLFVIIAAFLWLSSGGDPTQQRKAGAMIIAAVVGLVIAVMARLIPGIVVGIFA